MSAWGLNLGIHIQSNRTDRITAMAGNKSGGSNYRSAGTGRFVTPAESKASPRTTLKEARGGGDTGSPRSAVTGRFVTEAYAKSHPKTTVREK